MLESNSSHLSHIISGAYCFIELAACLPNIARNSLSDISFFNPHAISSELSDTNIPLRTVQRILPRLQEKAVLVRVGNRRSGKWKLIE